MFVEGNLGDHRSLERRHVARGQPVQRINDDVGATHLAPAELREMRPEGIVRLDGMIFHRILEFHSTAIACFARMVPVNVDPVVPVNRTS